MAEDGAIPTRYPLVELARAGYEEHTLKNVLDADATAIIHFGNLEGGTRQTRKSCAEHRKPCEVIDAEKTSPLDAAGRLASFIAAHDIATLNVAGPRASKWPGARDYAYEVVRHLIQAHKEQGSG